MAQNIPYWDEAEVVANALRDGGHDYYAKRLQQNSAGAATGGEVAGAYFALLVEILDLPGVSGDARTKAQQFFARLSKDLYYGNESHAAESAEYVRSRLKLLRSGPTSKFEE